MDSFLTFAAIDAYVHNGQLVVVYRDRNTQEGAPQPLGQHSPRRPPQKPPPPTQKRRGPFRKPRLSRFSASSLSTDQSRRPLAWASIV